MTMIVFKALQGVWEDMKIVFKALQGVLEDMKMVLWMCITQEECLGEGRLWGPLHVRSG